MENPEKHRRIQDLFNGEISMIYYDGFMYMMYDFFKHNGQMYCMALTDHDFEIHKITDEWFSSKEIYDETGYKDGYMLHKRHKNVPVIPDIFCENHNNEIGRLSWHDESTQIQRDLYCFLDKNNNLVFLMNAWKKLLIYMYPMHIDHMKHMIDCTNT